VVGERSGADLSFHVVIVRIRDLRNAKGWSEERLAEEAGMHRTYLGGIEVARRNPSLRNLIRIARALGVPVVRRFEQLMPACVGHRYDGRST
jgi:transcriptional regulator with XRE-family HTH domain